MDLDDFLNDYVEPAHDYIVRLAYKYKHDDYFTYSNEVLCSDVNNVHIWMYDWDEGYTNYGEVHVVNFVDIDDVFKERW